MLVRLISGDRPRSLLLGEWLTACGLGLLLCTFALNVRPSNPQAE